MENPKYNSPSDYNKHLDCDHENTSPCQPGLVAVYDCHGNHTGCLSPNDAEVYRNATLEIAEGYGKVYHPTTGEYLGAMCVEDACAFLECLSDATNGEDTTIYDRDGSFTGGAVEGERTVDMDSYNIGWINPGKWGLGVAADSIGTSTVTGSGEVDTPEVQTHTSSHFRTDGWYYTRFGTVLHQKANTGNTFAPITNLFLGHESGRDIDTVASAGSVGARNTAVGTFSSRKNTTGFGNTALGYISLEDNTTGTENTAVGDSAMSQALTGDRNVAVGNRAMLNGNTAEENVSIGANSFEDLEGSSNIGIGFDVASNYTNVDYCTIVGVQGGGLSSRTGLSELTLLGSKTSSSWSVNADSLTKSISIANDIDNSNEIRIGNVSDHTSAEVPVAWTVTSDERFKNIDKTAEVPGLDFIKNVNPIKYKLKDKETGKDLESKYRYGFSAQEIISLEGSDIVIGDDNNEDHLKLRESMLVPVLLNAVKELSREIEELKRNK